jgi:conjugal transfer pilus assembly protein TraB
MTEPTYVVKKKQLIYAGIAGSLGLLVIIGLIWSLGSDGVFESTPTSTPKETKIITAGQRINDQEVWVERIESEYKLTQEKLNSLQTFLEEHIKSTGKIEAQVNSYQEGSDQENLRSCSQPQGRLNEDDTAYSDENENTLPSVSESMVQEVSEGEGAPIGLGKIILKLSSRILPGSMQSGKKLGEKSTLENTLPAGAFAKAILLGGVDASTSVSSSSDPRPVLLRVTDHGTLPRKFKSDLKACHILASSYGDLSSERVYMRLEKLTCTERLTGEISETQVSGYVVGEDGRTGIRGIVTDKAGPLIRNSLVGGFFSGMGQFFSAQQQKAFLPVTALGQIPAIAPQQMLMSGASQGVSNAFEKYSEFFIKRAEQLQPVLQVAAGREVDIVFTQGTKFGETTVKKSLNKIRDRSRKAALQDLEEQSDNQSWIPSTEGDDE